MFDRNTTAPKMTARPAVIIEQQNNGVPAAAAVTSFSTAEAAAPKQGREKLHAAVCNIDITYINETNLMLWQSERNDSCLECRK